MNALQDGLRTLLERQVVQARDSAEAGARAALNRLAVSAREPHAHLAPDERVLRNRLRAHARQLGDRLNERTGEQGIERLTLEVAYEIWHRMLFARFLAENHLLMHPDGVAVSLQECEELAKEEGAPDGWVLASQYAARMLPEIFRPDDPLLQVQLAPEHQRELERLLADLPAEVFRADDSLGWVYQFWQSKRKKEVNDSGVKIGAEELSAVTQLFTEPYMVSFLLENTLGAWWAGRHRGEAPPVEMPYLRRLDDGTPAAGTFDGWPTRYSELSVLDPCCGSGHFLVAALKLLVPLRMHDEGIGAREAVDAVLRENLHGLELDARCTQIAAFAVALAAWTYPGAGGYRPLPELHVACSGTAVSAKKEDWLALAGGDTKLEAGLGRLYELFRQAPELGSLIDPTRGGSGDLLTASFEEVRPLLARALESEWVRKDAMLEATAVAAQGVTKAAALLAGRYTLVVTNVPFLHRSKQDTVLTGFIKQYHPAGKEDLATAFVERCRDFVGSGHSYALVTPQNWLFLTSYRKLRYYLLQHDEWGIVARLGPAAFRNMNWWAATTVLFILSRGIVTPDRHLLLLDTSATKDPEEKSALLRAQLGLSLGQRLQLENPDARISETSQDDVTLLAEFADSLQGIATADFSRYGRQFWELPWPVDGWTFQQSTVGETKPFGGREQIVYWEGGKGTLASSPQARIQGLAGIGKKGIAISQMRVLPASLYDGNLFDNNTAVIIPKRPEYHAAIWAFCSSPDFNRAVRRIDQKSSVTNATLVKVPFNFYHWQSVAEQQYPDGLPEPHSDDPTQWLFKGEVTGSTEPLQVAVARLLGYYWPDNSEDALDALADNDGIVCIPAVRGERPAADRLRDLLAAAYGSDWSPAKREALLGAVGYAGKGLDEWLRNGFFEQHFKLFHQRPFIWHVWDGRKDGFSALINYHKLDRKTLEMLAYTYLGDWINRQDEARRQEQTGAEGRLVAARELQQKLKRILDGEPPYDIFVRWKPLEEQPIGWDPDLNDGVRLNIRPFVQAGVLRKNPNVHWKKDRGTNPPGSPWGVERYNRYEDIPDREHPHLTNAIKRAAREVAVRPETGGGR